MKLHRIQATNLNSLYGDQVVDLDLQLGGASLFLVLGPTGSGKSTLMDAVSLALFGSTPRLEQLRSEIAVAEQVMSRGTGKAQAVVVFSKIEQGVRVRYRATWAARRARGRADGTMQPTQRSLERLPADGEPELLVDDHRDKVVRPVFDQVLEHFTAQDFQRSMLLAQGRFDAMLHADPEERASILERLTATVIYKDLGALAAGVRALWADRLRDLGAAVTAVAPPTAEALAALTTLVAEGVARAQALEAQVACLAGRRTWLLRAAELNAQADTASKELARVQGAEAQAAGDMVALGEHERCAEGFALRDQARRVAAQVARLHTQRQGLESSLPDLAGACTQARERTARAEAAHTAAEGALTALRGPAQGAREARQAVVRAQQHVEEARRDLTRRQQAVEREANLQQQREAAHRTAEQVLAAAQATLAAQVSDQPLAQALPELERRAVRLAESSSHAQALLEDLESQTQALTERAGALTARRQLLAAERAATLTPLEAERDARDTALAALVGAADPADALRDLRGLQESASRSFRLLEFAGQAQEARERARQRCEQRRALLDTAREALASAETDVAARQAGVVEAGAELERIAAVVAPLARISALGEQRDALEAGEPCPLCGSREHPFMSDAGQRAQAQAVASELSLAQATEARARAALQLAQQHLGRTRETSAGSRVAVESAQAEHAGAAELLAQAESDLTQALTEAGLAADVVDLAPSRAQAAAESEQLEARVRAVELAVTSARSAREALTAQERTLQARAAELDRLESALDEARTAHRKAADGLRKTETACDTQRQALAAALGVFGIHAVPAEAGLKAAQQRAQAWTDANTARETASQQLDATARELAHGAETLARARAEAAESGDAHQARGKGLSTAQTAAGAAESALRTAWADALALDGAEAVERPAADAGSAALLASQEARVSALRSAAHGADQELSQAIAAHSAAQARVEQLDAQLTGQRTEQLECEAQVQAALTDLDLPGPEDLDARRLPPEQLDLLRSQRETLRAARAHADAALEASRAQLARHAAERPEGLADGDRPETLEEQLATARAQRETQAQLLEQARADLQVAERDRAAHAQAQARYDRALERARVWLDLHELIGKAEGKHFQMFAQAMNLDRLLVRANQHLARLSERYRLRSLRDPATGLPSLDFVVEDAWQVGTTRSLRTLSGGESFLVSLALALGLSDLRTSSMPVETLMLDEGFGTLDPRTLEMALSALEQLQAAGRQVGIISHVAGLQERIQARIVVEPVGEGRSRVRAEL